MNDIDRLQQRVEYMEKRLAVLEAQRFCPVVPTVWPAVPFPLPQPFYYPYPYPGGTGDPAKLGTITTTCSTKGSAALVGGALLSNGGDANALAQ